MILGAPPAPSSNESVSIRWTLSKKPTHNAHEPITGESRSAFECVIGCRRLKHCIHAKPKSILFNQRNTRMI